jgi:alpha-L-fucosidase
MKTKIFTTIFILFTLCAMQAQNNSAHDKKMEWWREARFGMFIHWGPYAVLGGEYNGHKQIRGGAEWIMNRCKIPVAEYQAYARQFNPVKYNPEKWVKLAQEAGMKYIIMTSKHHDGFAMFKSNASDFNIVDFTPYKKDVLDELAKACRKYNMKLGFYYSHAQDWNNPGGAVARKVMSEGWLNPDSATIDAYTEKHNGHWDPIQSSRTMEQYINQVALPQIKELLTNYGDVAVIWWDTPTYMTDEFAAKLKAEVDKYPQIITNDRLKRPNFRGDFRTPEQKILGSDELDGSDWETCMTMDDSWGFRKNSQKWKSTETLVRNLIDIASKGGNYLLNVGPTPQGEIPKQSVKRLKEVGKWMKINGEAIYGTTRCFLEKPEWGCFTMKNTKENTILYLSVFNPPANRQILIREVKTPAQSCTLLAGKSNLKTELTGDGLVVYLPEKISGKIAAVIRLELKDKLINPHAHNLKQNDAAQPMNLTFWSKEADPKTIGDLVAKRFVESPHNRFRANEPPKSITYPEVCAWYGGLKYGESINDKNLLKRLEDRFIPFFGDEKSLVPRPVHVDNSVFGAIPLELFSINKEEKRFYELGISIADAQWTLPEDAPEEKKIAYKQLLDDGLTWQTRYWIDDMYMITLVQTEAYRVTGNPEYINRAAHEMRVYLDTIQRPNGLFYHAPDVPFFWGRGNGWMAAGMSELLSSLPENHSDRSAIMKGYLRMMKTLKEFQRPDGLWGQLIDDPYSWAETSCSGMFTYAMITGVKKGWLNADEYIPVIRKAWTELVKYINSDGDISNVCDGTNKRNDYRYYLDRQQKTGDMHGQAPVLWSAAALLER